MTRKRDPLSVWVGYKLGSMIAERRMETREPVAWLYNGVRSPGLPDDIREYPCAFIYDDKVGGTLYLAKKFLYYDADYMLGGHNAPNVTITGTFIRYFNNGNGVWENRYVGGTNSEDETNYCFCSGMIFWTNTDILNEDGTVLLTASEPVPVYE